MDESKLQENDHDDVPIHDRNEFFEFDGKTYVDSLSLCDALKCCLLKFAINGADKVFLDRKFSKRNLFGIGFGQRVSSRALQRSFSGERGKDWGSGSKGCYVYGECAFEQKRGKTSGALQQKEMVGAKMGSDVLEPIKDGFGVTNEWNKEYVDVSEVVNSPSGNYSEFPFNFLAFFAVVLMKFMGFQFNLLVSFFTFPIWLSYFSFLVVMFPFQTLRHARGYFMKKLFRWWGISSRNVSQKAQQSIGNIAMRFGCGFFWSTYVFLMLLGLLASGFVFGGIVMMNLVEKPVQTTETLNFDYTKTNPVAFVPIMRLSGVGDISSLVAKDNVEAGKLIGARFVPHNHKLQLTLAFVMPESEYNRKLGVFQVRVEFLSARGEVTASLRQPCIMRFKSQPIRVVETIIKSAPIIAGFVSEAQILNIKMDEFTEGLEPTAYLKVMLEQRAEYKAGAGIPEVYAASLSLESELPQLRRLIWLWKRTIFME
ncbi:unnamed protein product [Dovyalis caffra]|uniref:Uncharacterized protein n=1 Tax=Dovyalis caffra TaxID=77055 RepID=A0AAV1SIU6_9ROSI|nr:unnamed protein product [Dovyalis caffra]